MEAVGERRSRRQGRDAEEELEEPSTRGAIKFKSLCIFEISIKISFPCWRCSTERKSLALLTNNLIMDLKKIYKYNK